MAFGDALLGIQEQLVPAQGTDFGSILSDPQPVGGASVQQLPATLPATGVAPQEAPVLQLSPDNVKRMKGIGKFFNSLTDVLADPATQKALASIGIGLDPRGVGGTLGQLGSSLAEANARDEFRAAIEAGGDPNSIRVSGLSSEGRLTELEAFRQGQSLTRQEEQRQFENVQTVEAGERQQQVLNIREGELSLDQRSADLREEELEESIRRQKLDEELDQAKLKLDESRVKFQNLRDLASARASDALAASREEGEIVDVNKQRVAFLDETATQRTDLQGKLRKAQRELEEAEANTTGLTAALRRGFSETVGDGSQRGKDAQTVAQARLKVGEIERAIADLDNMQRQVLQDFQKDLAGQTNFAPISVTSGQSQTTPGQLPQVEAGPGELPVARTLEEFNTITEGTTFFMPDPATGRPVKVVKVNGKARRVVE